MNGTDLAIEQNAAAAAAADIDVSVLIPFYRDDPRALAAAIAAQSNGAVELLCFDDGAPDAGLNAAVLETVHAAATPATLITSPSNRGRAAARNALAARARGRWLLFLDADMRIDDGFIARWRRILEDTACDAVFGGYAPVVPAEPRLAVHAALAHASDVRDARARDREGAVAMCSSNLAVRAAFFARVPFDEGYAGWGWEDVDWALTAERLGRTGHADAPAGHDGLQDVGTLLRKFEAAGPNFARLLERHPGYEARPGARLARRLQHARLAGPARLFGALLARLSPAPLRLRVVGLKLFRAAAAAEALS